MKKHLLIVPLLFGSITVIAFQNQIRGLFVTEKAANKEIRLSLNSDSIYSSKAYDEALAQVQVSIKKIRGDKETTVWRKDFANTQLKQFGKTDPLGASVHVPVLDSKEKLEVEYNIIYNSDGKALQLTGKQLLDKKSSHEVEIVI